MAASPQSFSTPHTNRSHHLWNWASSVMGCLVVETWKNTCQIDLRSVRHSSPLCRPMPDPILSNSLSLRDCPLHWSSYSGAAWLEDVTQSAVQDLAPEARHGRALSVANSRGIFKTCSALYQINSCHIIFPRTHSKQAKAGNSARTTNNKGTYSRSPHKTQIGNSINTTERATSQ